MLTLLNINPSKNWVHIYVANYTLFHKKLSVTLNKQSIICFFPGQSKKTGNKGGTIYPFQFNQRK